MKKFTLLSAFAIIIGLTFLQNARADPGEYVACFDNCNRKSVGCFNSCDAPFKLCKDACGSDEACKERCWDSRHRCYTPCHDLDACIENCKQQYSAYFTKVHGLRTPEVANCFDKCNERKRSCWEGCHKPRKLCIDKCEMDPGSDMACINKCYDTEAECSAKCPNDEDCFEVCKKN